MSEIHLAERLMYPLPDGWQQDHEQVAALKEIWPKVIAKNKELIDAEISKLKSQLEEARRGLKIALHALKNVDGPFIEHEGAHGIFLAKEHDCTCWDAEQTVTAFLNGSAK